MINKRQIFIIAGFIILVLAIPITLYLVRQTQIFKPKAAFLPKAVFLDAAGNIITQTSSKNVKLRITREVAPTPSPSPSISPSPTPAGSPSPSPVSSPSPSPSSTPTPVPTPSPTPLPTPTPTPAGLTNLLLNGGFENNLSSWGCSGAVSGRCDLDSTTKFSGRAAAKVTNTGGFWGWQLAQGNIQAALGEQFCLSARVKLGLVSDRISIALQETGGDFQGQQVIFASPGTDWQLVKSSVTVGANWVLPVQVYLRAWNQGNIGWFDDVSLTRGACTSSV